MPSLFECRDGCILRLVGLRRQAQISENAIVAISGGLGKALAIHGNDAFSTFSRGFGDQLFEPSSKVEDSRRSDNRKLIASVIGGDTQDRPQNHTRVRIGSSSSAARLHHLLGVLQKLRNIEAHNRRGHQAKIRKRRISPTDTGHTHENPAEFVRFRDLLHLGARVRDSDKTIAGFLIADLRLHALKKVLLVNIRLERASGFARHDANRALEVHLGFNSSDLRGIRGIQNVQFRKSFDLSERHAQNFRAEAGTTHAQQQGMLKARFLHLRGNFLEGINVCELFPRDGEPAEPIALVSPRPERSIFLPQPRHLVVSLPVFYGCSNLTCKRASQLVGLAVQAHAGTPAVLLTASSRVLKASANSLTPSTISLSVTSFIEIPALARSAMVFAAPSTFSVRLGRSFPWSRNASIVAGGIVSTVSAPMSSST